jgi:hypothetical protein
VRDNALGAGRDVRGAGRGAVPVDVSRFAIGTCSASHRERFPTVVSLPPKLVRLARPLLNATTMRMFGAGFMTWLSRSRVRIALVLAMTACADREITSLVGEVTCGSLTCGEGQLCREFEPHPDEATQYSCVTVSAGCDVFDCSSDDRGCPGCEERCPACILELCGYLTRVEGRELMCAGF